ncbi:MAG: hypothetical protein A3E84_03335 [Gammaproteobacteria bacterium RIFCSPHIGHO2_12_FULL_42_13]|nr:MAG: hypothetical protein A3E84_03335 [Gammaproteobacteria bacterium RIFCSPHIGHO2_12_FULL_42_13]
MKGKKIEFSVELFPTANASGQLQLQNTIERLEALGPRFFSVTFGAAGFSTQHLTTALVSELIDSDIAVAPHISCLNLSTQEVDALLKQYHAQGVQRLVVIRGDDPDTNNAEKKARVFPYAIDLVRYIRSTTGNRFELFVAAYPEFHPEAPACEHEFHYLKEKFLAGADAAITQYFFSGEAYECYLENCAKLRIHLPIIPGVMPIVQYDRLMRFSNRCGAEIPRWLSKRLEAYQHEPIAFNQFGIDVVTKFCESVIALGAPSLHFYTLNSANLCEQLIRNLSGHLVSAKRYATTASFV